MAVAVVANACELVEQAPPPIRLRLDSPLGIAFGGGQLVSTEWPCRILFEEGGIHCEDLCSEDLLGQDQFNPLAHAHSDEDAEH